MHDYKQTPATEMAPHELYGQPLLLTEELVLIADTLKSDVAKFPQRTTLFFNEGYCVRKSAAAEACSLTSYSNVQEALLAPASRRCYTS